MKQILDSRGACDGGGDPGHVRPALRSGVSGRPPTDVPGGTLLARPLPHDRRHAPVARAFPDRESAPDLPSDGPRQHQRDEGQRPAGRAGAAPRGRRDHGGRQLLRDPFLRVVGRRDTDGGVLGLRQADAGRRRARPRLRAAGRPQRTRAGVVALRRVPGPSPENSPRPTPTTSSRNGSAAAAWGRSSGPGSSRRTARSPSR